jgi:integrase
MVNFAAYTGLRWGELVALTVDRIDQELRQVAVDRKSSRSAAIST